MCVSRCVCVRVYVCVGLRGKGIENSKNVIIAHIVIMIINECYYYSFPFGWFRFLPTVQRHFPQTLFTTVDACEGGKGWRIAVC